MITENNLGFKLITWELAKWEKILYDTSRDMMVSPNEVGAAMIKEAERNITQLKNALQQLKS